MDDILKVRSILYVTILTLTVNVRNNLQFPLTKERRVVAAQPRRNEHVYKLPFEIYAMDAQGTSGRRCIWW